MGLVVIINAPLIGTVKFSPLKNKSWLITTPVTAQRIIVPKSFRNNFSRLINHAAIKKKMAAGITLNTIKP